MARWRGAEGRLFLSLESRKCRSPVETAPRRGQHRGSHRGGKGPLTTTPPNGVAGMGGFFPQGSPASPSAPSLPSLLPAYRAVAKPRRPHFREKRESSPGGPQGAGSQCTVPLSPRAPATPTGGRRAGLGDDARSLQPACGQGVPICCVRRNRLGPERGGLRAERATGVTRAAQRPTFVGICKTEKPKRRMTE